MENKKTNRNTKLIILAIVLALVVLFLCIGGSTFARYISSKDVPTQQATVAKWGFVVNANTKNLFGDSYDDGTIVVASEDADADATQLDVKADGNVVAPGTKGSMTFGVTGNAEVLAELTLVFEAKNDVSLTTGTGESATVYNPVKWTLNDGKKDVVEDGTLAQVEAALADVNTLVEAGESVTISYTLSWKWELGDKNAPATTDSYDTLLGYAAMGNGTHGDVEVTVAEDGVITVKDNAPATAVTYTAVTEIEFDLSIKVVQIANSERPAVTPEP